MFTVFMVYDSLNAVWFLVENIIIQAEFYFTLVILYETTKKVCIILFVFGIFGIPFDT